MRPSGFGVLLAAHPTPSSSQRQGVEELERAWEEEKEARGGQAGRGLAPGSTGADEHLHTTPLRCFRQMQSAISFAGKPAHARQPSRRQGGTVARFPVSTPGGGSISLAMPRARVFAGPNTSAGEHPESPTPRRVAPSSPAARRRRRRDPRRLARCTASAPGGEEGFGR
jgi:hypothetical protein